MGERTDIAGLIERLEAATGPSEELDEAVCIALQYGGGGSEGAANVRADPYDKGWLAFEIGSEECCNPVPYVTASLDAALALVERVRPGWKVSLFIGHLTGKKNGEGCRAELHAPGRPKRIAAQDWKWPKMAACYYAPTPAIALLIALLRTLETEQ